MNQATIRFEEGRGIVVPLEVHGQDWAVSMEDLQSLLFALRVQVVGAEELVEGDQLVQRVLVCEFDGGPLRIRRRRAIVADLTQALSRAASRQTEVAGPGVAAAVAIIAPRSSRHAA